MEIKIRKATHEDQEAVVELLDVLDLEKGFEIEEFLVAEYLGRIIGCACLKDFNDYLELCSVGVLEDYQKLGVGSEIIKALIKDADHRKIYCVTPYPSYFSRFGFKEIPKVQLPKDLQDKTAMYEEAHDEKWLAMAR